MTLWIALFLLPGLVIGLTLHEFAHAYAASLLGDDFPRRNGRVSLNPFRHLSVLGTIVLFWLGFGWGKPVVVNLYNFRRPKRDYLLCSLAGPTANVLVTGVCVLLMWAIGWAAEAGGLAGVLLRLASAILRLIATINVVLAAFNLLPIPPLDGSKIWPCLIPGLRPTFGGRRANWFFLALLIVLLSTGTLRPLTRGVYTALDRLMPDPDRQRVEQFMRRGQEAARDGRPAAAEDWYSRALSVDPNHPECLLLRAEARARQGKIQEGRDDFTRWALLNEGRPPMQSDPRCREIIGRLFVSAGTGSVEPALDTRPGSLPATGPATGTPAGTPGDG